jgi:NAD(P)-dependent dehydrogenase (short-subunit alcohol dehydrogenase family)
LITGGDSGISKAVAILFAKEGADIAIAYLKLQGCRDVADNRTAIWTEMSFNKGRLVREKHRGSCKKNHSAIRPYRYIGKQCVYILKIKT